MALFPQFDLLQGPRDDEFRLVAAHASCESAAALTDWTRSEAFRKAHANAGDSKGIYLGPPKFEGFESVL